MPAPLDPRRTALLVWAAQLGGSLLFLGVATFLRSGGFGAAVPEALVWLGLVVPVLLVGASFPIPALVKASGDPEAVARARFVVGWALREAAALFGTVIFLLSGDARPVAGFAIGLSALAVSMPTPDRWRAAVEAAGGKPGRPPMVGG